MFKVLALFGEVLKSSLVTDIIQALIRNIHVTAPSEAVTRAVTDCAANASVAHAANAVLASIVPALSTWTQDEVAAAERTWVSSHQTSVDADMASAFMAGVEWALSHQAASLKAGIAQAVEAHEAAKAGAGEAVQAAVPGISVAAVEA